MDKATCLRIALSVADVTLEAFARRLGVSVTMIYRVMSGSAKSARVSAAIDDFVSEQLLRLEPEVRAAARERRPARIAA